MMVYKNSRTISRAASLLALILFLGVGWLVSQETEGFSMPNAKKQADDAVEKFSQSRAFSDSAAALDLLKRLSFPENQGKSLEPDPLIAHSWLKLLLSLDETVSDLQKNLEYPRTKIYATGSHGNQANISPSSITDPDERAEYEARVKENEARKANARNYSNLINLTMKANAYFSTWAQSHYRGHTADQNAIIADAESLHMAPDRIDSIKKVVGAPGPQLKH